MPLYEYECEACGQRFEIIQKFSDPPPEACRLCGKGPARRLHSSPAIQFKGSGFYITDYARKGQSEASSSTGSGSSKNEASKTEGKTDTAGKSDAAKSDSAKTEAPAAKSDKA